MACRTRFSTVGPIGDLRVRYPAAQGLSCSSGGQIASDDVVTGDMREVWFAQ
jgi:hypothetical protein